MTRIHARESLERHTLLVIASGKADKSKARQVLARWRRDANQQGNAEPRRRPDAEQWRAALGGSGIGLEIIDVGKPRASGT